MTCSNEAIMNTTPLTKQENTETTVAKTKTHPCFNGEAHDYARMHIPVAPKCNVQCNYCNRAYDCQNESRPGVTSSLLSPQEACDKFVSVKEKMPNLSVVGIAGPGDAMANYEATVNSIKLIKEADPDITFCLSTNGLNLLPHIDELIALGVTHFTVTVNTIYEEVAAKIYKFVEVDGTKYFGLEAGRIMIERQWKAIRYLRDKDVITKVNIVYMKGINDDHIHEVVERARTFDVSVTNIMPLIPVAGTVFHDLEKASQEELHAMRKKCSEILPQMTHCNQCRADAIGTLRHKGCGKKRSLA